MRCPTAYTSKAATLSAKLSSLPQAHPRPRHEASPIVDWQAVTREMCTEGDEICRHRLVFTEDVVCQPIHHQRPLYLVLDCM